MTYVQADTTPTLPRAFWIALLANMAWMNLSETARYFALVMPMMRATFPRVPHVAPMNVPVFMSWGVWDTILIVATTGAAWFVLQRFGPTFRVALLAATGLWTAIFGILWLGLYNMSLATMPILAVALPLAWIELVVAVLIVRWAMLRR